MRKRKGQCRSHFQGINIPLPEDMTPEQLKAYRGLDAEGQKMYLEIAASLKTMEKSEKSFGALMEKLNRTMERNKINDTIYCTTSNIRTDAEGNQYKT